VHRQPKAAVRGLAEADAETLALHSQRQSGRSGRPECDLSSRHSRVLDDDLTVAVGIVVEAYGETREGKEQPAGRSDDAEEAQQRAEPDGHSAERDDQRHEHRDVQSRFEEMMEGARENRTAQLWLEGSGRRRVEEVRVGRLLQSRKFKHNGQKARWTSRGPPGALNSLANREGDTVFGKVRS
jgi:hypothetical protein